MYQHTFVQIMQQLGFTDWVIQAMIDEVYARRKQGERARFEEYLPEWYKKEKPPPANQWM